MLVHVRVSAESWHWRGTSNSSEIVLITDSRVGIRSSKSEHVKLNPFHKKINKDCWLTYKMKQYLSWQVLMLLVEAVNPPPIVVPATVRPGLAGKVRVQEIFPFALGGVIQVNGLLMAVSEHFLMTTKHQQFLIGVRESNFETNLQEQQTPAEAKRMVPQLPSLTPPWPSHSPWVRQTPSSPDEVLHFAPETGKMDVNDGIVPSEGMEPMPNSEVVVGVVEPDVCGARPSTPALNDRLH